MILIDIKKYCNDVLIDNIIACKSIKSACNRFLNDLDREDLYFDEDAVVKFVNFCKLFRHFTGQYNGKAFTLKTWQLFFIGNLFGLKYKKDNTRKYQRCYFSLARKQGKSSLIAIISLYCMIADNEANAEVVIVANSVDQARINLSITSSYASQIDPTHKIITPQYSRIKYKNNRLQIRASEATKLDGLNSSCIIVDECAYTRREVIDVLLSGQVSRSQPLFLMLGTAGTDITTYMYGQYQLYKQMLNGDVSYDDRLLIIIYEIDAEDLQGDKYLNDIDILRKSNPNFGVSVIPGFLQSQLDNVKTDNTNKGGVVVKHGNRWLDSEAITNEDKKYVDDELVMKASKTLDWDYFRGCWAFVGVDLSSVKDLNAVTFLFVKDKYFYFKTLYYLPKDNTNRAAMRKQIEQWSTLGYITLTPGNALDVNYIVKDIIDITKKCNINIIELALDNYNSGQFQVELSKVGINYVPYSQSFLSMNKPTKELLRLIINGQAIIDQNSITRYCFHNAEIIETQNGNVKVFKKNKDAKNKIDGVVSSIMALGNYLNSNYVYSSN